MLTWAWVKNLPSQLNGPSCEVSDFSIRSIASHSRSRMRIGLALPETISVAPDLTKPMSSRPRDNTSIVAYSVATRTGSGRTVISVPSDRIRTFLVSRCDDTPAFDDRTRGPEIRLIPEWCSLVTICRPISSQSQLFFNTPPRINRLRSPARNKLFGRLARTSRGNSVQHLRRHESLGVLAVVPQFHRARLLSVAGTTSSKGLRAVSGARDAKR